MDFLAGLLGYKKASRLSEVAEARVLCLCHRDTNNVRISKGQSDFPFLEYFLIAYLIRSDGSLARANKSGISSCTPGSCFRLLPCRTSWARAARRSWCHGSRMTREGTCTLRSSSALSSVSSKCHKATTSSLVEEEKLQLPPLPSPCTRVPGWRRMAGSCLLRRANSPLGSQRCATPKSPASIRQSLSLVSFSPSLI